MVRAAAPWMLSVAGLVACGGGAASLAPDSGGPGTDAGGEADPDAPSDGDGAVKPPPVCRPGTYQRRKDRPGPMDNMHSATVLQDGRLLAAGAAESGNGPLTIYDPAADTWIALTGGMTMHRQEHAAALLLDGRVLMVGGETDEDYQSTTAEIVDVRAASPTPPSVRVPSMTAHRLRPKAVTLPTGQVLVGGGDWDLFAPVPAFEIYDPVSNGWRVTKSPDHLLTFPSLLVGYRSTERFTMTSLRDGRVLVTGSNIPDDCGRAFLYDASTDSWSPIEPLAERIAPAASALLPDGRVLVTGGTKCTPTMAEIGDASATTLVFDPTTMHWSRVASLNVPRVNPSASQLPCGGMFVSGGSSDQRNMSGSWVGQPEYYDVATDQWTLLRASAGGYDDHVRTLPDGTIVLTFPTAVYK